MAFPPPFGTVYPVYPGGKSGFKPLELGRPPVSFFCMFHRNRQVHEQRTEALERSIQAAPRNRKIVGGWPSVDMQASDFLCGSLWRKTFYSPRYWSELSTCGWVKTDRTIF